MFSKKNREVSGKKAKRVHQQTIKTHFKHYNFSCKPKNNNLTKVRKIFNGYLF
jgi:hypothetical protein